MGEEKCTLVTYMRYSLNSFKGVILWITYYRVQGLGSKLLKEGCMGDYIGAYPDS